jgi:hypothetical protein
MTVDVAFAISRSLVRLAGLVILCLRSWLRLFHLQALAHTPPTAAPDRLRAIECMDRAPGGPLIVEAPTSELAHVLCALLGMPAYGHALTLPVRVDQSSDPDELQPHQKDTTVRRP